MSQHSENASTTQVGQFFLRYRQARQIVLYMGSFYLQIFIG